MRILLKTTRLMAVVALATTVAFTSISAQSSEAPAKGNSSRDAFVLVVDPGHGGNDAGAVDNGQKEKDINLAVAKELQTLLRKEMKDAKVIMTRDGDTYLTLQQRADKANQAKGDLFISIHTNSVAKENKNRKSVSGASVYTLGLHKDGSNMEVARRENSVIELESDYARRYSGFDPTKDESYIIFEMTQKKNLHNSIRFAKQAQENLVKYAGRKDRGVHQAGFWVLWATSMPSVLVELDFICNPDQASFMGSEKGVRAMAEALAEAVKEYAGGLKGMSVAAEVIPEPIETLEGEAVDEPEPGTKTRNAAMSLSAKSPETAGREAYAQRRRRTAASRKKSETRDLQTADIPLHTASERMPGEEKVKEENPILSAKEMGRLEKEAKKKAEAARRAERKVRNQAEKEVREEARERAKGQKTEGRTRGVQHIRKIYKIQILASHDNLNPANTRFQGLAPVSVFRENNLYKYTYGECKTKEEAETLLKQVKTKIPDAFVIEVKVI